MGQKDNKSADEQVRQMAFAVANWLAGVLEGGGRDDIDTTLAEALDTWLRHQKQDGQTLYSGRTACNSCGHEWDFVVFAGDTDKLQCPQCRTIQAAPVAPGKAAAAPENKDALEKVQRDAGDVISKIAALGRIINDEKTV